MTKTKKYIYDNNVIFSCWFNHKERRFRIKILSEWRKNNAMDICVVYSKVNVLNRDIDTWMKRDIDEYFRRNNIWRIE